jgi:hypothetical protein
LEKCKKNIQGEVAGSKSQVEGRGKRVKIEGPYVIFNRLKRFLMDNGDNKGLATGGVAAPR